MQRNDPAASPAANDAAPRYRSGAVARMLRMPVATLRIWERRYRVATPATTPAGHRLYSSADVKRLALLKQLTAVGHAIGAIAALDTAELQQVAATHAGAMAGDSSTRTSATREPLQTDASSASPDALRSAWPRLLDPSPRRFDDATLADLAGLSSTIACECPQHLAQLLMQLSHFEAYSADCAHRSPSDAALHRYLHRVAGAARALFEDALERVAVHEGLVLAG